MKLLHQIFFRKISILNEWHVVWILYIFKNEIYWINNTSKPVKGHHICPLSSYFLYLAVEITERNANTIPTSPLPLYLRPANHCLLVSQKSGFMDVSIVTGIFLLILILYLEIYITTWLFRLIILLIRRFSLMKS